MDFINLITTVFGGDMITVILKLVLGLGVGVAAFFFYRWLDNKLKAEAHKKTVQDRAKEQADLDQENRDIFDDAKKSEDEIEDIIRKKKK